MAGRSRTASAKAPRGARRGGRRRKTEQPAAPITDGVVKDTKSDQGTYEARQEAILVCTGIEVETLRRERMEHAIEFGNKVGLKKDAWVPYVMEKLGGFSRDFIKKVYHGTPVFHDEPKTECESTTHITTSIEAPVAKVDEPIPAAVASS